MKVGKRDIAGGMDRLLEVLKFDDVARDALNAPIARWTSAGTFSARQITQRAIEAWKAGQSAGQAELVFRFRFNPVTAAIAPRDRLEDAGGRVFEVVGIPTEPLRRTYIDVACISVPA